MLMHKLHNWLIHSLNQSTETKYTIRVKVENNHPSNWN